MLHDLNSDLNKIIDRAQYLLKAIPISELININYIDTMSELNIESDTALHKKMKFSIKNFFSKCDQVRSQNHNHNHKKKLMTP